MFTNEVIDAMMERGFVEDMHDIAAQAKEANALREQLANARRDALESAASYFESTHRELWTPQVADELRALKEKP